MKFKNLLLFAVVLLAASSFSFAQTSDQGFSFQGYAIDPDGKALGSTAITVKFTLSPGTFTEEHTLTTDAFGVFSAIVGNSSAAKKAEFKQLDFTAVDAANPTYYQLKVEVKKTSGGTYTTISDQPMLSVPYARQAANGVPVGTIIAYGGPTTKIPYGWALCDGASKDGTNAQWKQLFDVIGLTWGGSGSNFNLPDLRGRFLRGVDGTDGAGGLDPDDASRTACNTGGNTGNKVGTVQGDETKSHTHTADQASHTHNYEDSYWMENPGSKPAGSTAWDPGTNTGSDGGDGDNDAWQIQRGSYGADPDITVSSTGGNETRPKNAAVHYIIKY